MSEVLREWIIQNQPSDEMHWKEAWKSQVFFVRDQIAGLVSRSYDEYRDMIDVVGTHTSKSITCPVYFIDLQQDGVKIWMRYNFFNWNVSVESVRPITCSFLGTADDRNHDYCYCEGMEEWKFGEYAKDNKRFTVCINNHWDCYTFFRCLKVFLGIMPGEE